MTIRAKTTWVVVTALLAAFVVMYSAMSGILLKRFERLEIEHVSEDIRIVRNALAVNIDSLAFKAADWAAWDDTYQYVEDLNPDYIEANLVDEGFTALGINLLMIADTKGQVLVGKAFDLEKSREVTVPVELAEMLGPEQVLGKLGDDPQAVRKGVVMLPQGPMMVAARPIVTSQFEGPVRGVFLMGRWLDEKQVKYLAETTRQSLMMHEVRNENAPPEFRQAAGEAERIRPAGEETIMAYLTVPDVSGKPAVVIRIEQGRDVYQQGLQTRQTLIGAYLIAGVVFAGLLLWGLEVQVVSRVLKLAKQVVGIGEQANFAGRVELSGSDELARLAFATNQTLNELNKAEVLLADAKAGVEEQVKQRTRELSEEQAKLRASINSLPIGFLITNHDCKVIHVNPAVIQLLKVVEESHDATAKKLEEILNFREHCRRVIETKRVTDMPEVEFEGKYFHLFVVPINLTSGETSEVIGTAVVVEDITAAKLLERSKDEFFALASHELRTPLTAIRGNASMIKEYFASKLKNNTEVMEMLDDIHAAGVRLIQIVNDFLDVSRLEQGKAIMKEEVFALDKLAAEVVRELAPLSKEKKIYLRMGKTSGVCPEVMGDSERAKQVLVNLIGNSIKFTEAGGVEVNCREEAGMTVVTIADTGIGILKQNQELLFHKFQQAGEKILTRDSTRGTGVGLYISQLLARNMGGRLELTSSELGKGSTFTFGLLKAGKK